MVNPQERGGQIKTHKFWQTPSIDFARMGCQKLIDSMPGRIQRSWKRRVNTSNIDSLHQFHVIVNKSLWHLWNACNYNSVVTSDKSLKSLKQQTLWKLIFVSFSKLLATTVCLLTLLCISYFLFLFVVYFASNTLLLNIALLSFEFARKTFHCTSLYYWKIQIECLFES